MKEQLKTDRYHRYVGTLLAVGCAVNRMSNVECIAQCGTVEQLQLHLHDKTGRKMIKDDGSSTLAKHQKQQYHSNYTMMILTVQLPLRLHDSVVCIEVVLG